MKDDYLVVFGEQNIELDQITFEEGSLDALKRVLRENAAVASVSDDHWFLRGPHLYF